MLRDESNAKLFDRPLSSARRTLTFFGLVGLTIGVATLRGPARGSDDTKSPAVKSEVVALLSHKPLNSFVTPYVREGRDGMVVIRPAAAFRHNGMDRLLAFFHRELGEVLAMCRQAAQGRCLPAAVLESPLPGYRVVYRRHRLRSVSPKGPSGKASLPCRGAVREPMHRINFGTLAIRMIAPFDWLAFLRQWQCECEEVRRMATRTTGLRGSPHRFSV